MSQEPDTKPGYYYVTVRRRDGEFRPLRGPFVNDHASALAAVDDARMKACNLDPRAHWYAFGTARSEMDLGPGIFDKPVHYQTGRGTLCSLDNDASVRTPSPDWSGVTCRHCLKLLEINSGAAA
jgi:hypothetical protein